MFGFSKKTDKEIKQVIEDGVSKQKENQLKWHNYLLSAIFVLAGLILIVYVQIDIAFICRFLAAVFAIGGIVSIISYCLRDVTEGYYRLELVYGITAAFAALLFYTKQDAMEAYFPVIAGFILFANGVIKLQHSIDMKRIDRKMKKVTEMWLVVMIFALMCIAAGFVTAYIKTAESRTMFLVIGISFIVAGLSDVFVHIVFNRKVRLFRSGDYIKEEETGSAAAAQTLPQDKEADPEEGIPGWAVNRQNEPAIDVTEESAEEKTEDIAEDTADMSAQEAESYEQAESEEVPDDAGSVSKEIEFPSWTMTDKF